MKKAMRFVSGLVLSTSLFLGATAAFAEACEKGFVLVCTASACCTVCNDGSGEIGDCDAID